MKVMRLGHMTLGTTPRSLTSQFEQDEAALRAARNGTPPPERRELEEYGTKRDSLIWLRIYLWFSLGLLAVMLWRAW